MTSQGNIKPGFFKVDISQPCPLLVANNYGGPSNAPLTKAAENAPVVMSKTQTNKPPERMGARNQKKTNNTSKSRPSVALEFIQEVSMDGKAIVSFCKLCKCQMGLNENNVLCHASGRRHKANYENYLKDNPNPIRLNPVIPKIEIKEEVLDSDSEGTVPYVEDTSEKSELALVPIKSEPDSSSYEEPSIQIIGSYQSGRSLMYDHVMVETRTKILDIIDLTVDDSDTDDEIQMPKKRQRFEFGDFIINVDELDSD